MAEVITDSELFAEFQKLGLFEKRRRNDKGRTSREWSEILGVSRSAVRELVRLARRHGWVTQGWRTDERVDTRRCEIPVYWFHATKPASD